MIYKNIYIEWIWLQAFDSLEPTPNGCGDGPALSKKGLIFTKNFLGEKKEERLIFLSSLYFYTGTLPRITWNQWSWLWFKSPYTHTHKKRITQQSNKTKDHLKWIAHSKGAAFGRDMAVLVNQYCQNRCLYHTLLFILHQESNSTWWSLGRKHSIANCFSRTEESRFMEEIAPKM